MAEPKTTDIAQAEDLREQLENHLGEAVDALTEAQSVAGSLKAAFEGDPDREDEYKQASSWEHRLVFNDLPNILGEVSGEEPDEDVPVILTVDRRNAPDVIRALVLVRELDSGDFDNDVLDEVATNLQSSL